MMVGKTQEYDMFFSQVVDKTSNEAEVIIQYVKNTHAATHNTYTLEVQEVSRSISYETWSMNSMLQVLKSEKLKSVEVSSSTCYHLLDLQNCS